MIDRVYDVRVLTLAQNTECQAIELCERSCDDLPTNSKLHAPSTILSDAHAIEGSQSHFKVVTNKSLNGEWFPKPEQKSRRLRSRI